MGLDCLHKHLSHYVKCSCNSYDIYCNSYDIYCDSYDIYNDNQDKIFLTKTIKIYIISLNDENTFITKTAYNLFNQKLLTVHDRETGFQPTMYNLTINVIISISACVEIFPILNFQKLYQTTSQVK